MLARFSSSLFAAMTALSFTVAPPALADQGEKQAILWKIDKANTPSSWLLATIQTTDGQTAEFTPATLAALGGAKYIGTEFHNDINSVVDMARTMLDEKPSLAQTLGAADYAKLLPLIESRGYPASVTAKLKPWAAIMMLLSPRPAKDLIPMDDRLLKYSMENGRKYFGVESVEQQLAPFQAIPAAKQIPLLKTLIKNEAKLEQNYKQIVAAYLKQDLNQIQKLLQIEALALPEADRAWYRQWRNETLNQRNKIIVERLKIPFEKGDSFVGINAGQLPGKDGLIAKLRAAGYSVSAFSAAK
ncbi:TraB/GumN family protein [Deefgea piscis]|uniref:TraB/GumN family protein n=1 Tax=Deefgea piscis TaxID=2739061 RepID=A0A6M8SS64_9NEIS|nr:TraB/GumN family protein [Deefgea piscis]QKJ66918.1 TraB/GumN family protein [Deefgea piscis]